MSAQIKANILLADDNAAKRLALAAALENLGHNLYLAESGEDALRLILQRDYAVVLLDVLMPGMGGFEVAKLIRAREQSAHTPIVFITAYDGAEAEVLRGYSLGAVDYIFSPIIPEILRAKVGAFVDLAVMRQKLESEVAERRRAATEIDALNASLTLRASELEAANQELASFSYSVSHDLRTPLRAVDGFSRILEEDHAGRLDAEGRRLLAVIRESTQRMGRLIDDLLEFSRVGRKPLSSAGIDMKRLVEDVLNDVSVVSGRPPRVVLGELPPAQGDAAMVKQVWANLLANAVKFSSKRELPLVEVSGEESGEEIVYCVKDNGAGFDMEYYGKLFSVFQRLHSAHEFSGTGVGLAIVQRIVTRHGGRVWAEGRVGKGATFFFSLPSPSSHAAA
jgi:two-component system sensor histidine kinase/response regulator